MARENDRGGRAARVRPGGLDGVLATALSAPRAASLAALAAVTVWGISFVATRAALTALSPVTLVFTRFSLGLAVLFLLLAARGRVRLPPRDSWAALASIGFLGVFVHQMLQAHGLELTTAVHTGWLVGLTPIWSAILGGLVLKERLRARQAAGLALGFLGAALVVTRGALGADLLALPSTRGDLLILASTVNWAICSIVGREALARLGSLRAIAFAMLAGWTMLAPLFVLRSGWKEYASVPASAWGAVAFLGVGCSGLGYLFWYFALERLDTARVASFLYIEPLVTLLAAVALLGEPVHPTTVLGGLIVLAGVRLAQASGLPASDKAVSRKWQVET